MTALTGAIDEPEAAVLVAHLTWPGAGNDDKFGGDNSMDSLNRLGLHLRANNNNERVGLAGWLAGRRKTSWRFLQVSTWAPPRRPARV